MNVGSVTSDFDQVTSVFMIKNNCQVHVCQSILCGNMCSGNDHVCFLKQIRLKIFSKMLHWSIHPDITEMWLTWTSNHKMNDFCFPELLSTTINIHRIIWFIIRTEISMPKIFFLLLQI